MAALLFLSLLAVIILFSFGEDVFRSKLVLYFVLLANVPYILEIQMPVIATIGRWVLRNSFIFSGHG